MFFSYVRSRARGDLNDFGNFLGTVPVTDHSRESIRHLGTDLPNRFLSWGVVRLTKTSKWPRWLNTEADSRTSKPTPSSDYVGIPIETATRFPVARFPLLKGFEDYGEIPFGLSVTGFNLTNHFNPEAVHRTRRSGVRILFGHRGRRFTSTSTSSSNSISGRRRYTGSLTRKVFMRSVVLLLFAIIPLQAAEQDALAISANIQAKHLPYGTILDPIYAAKDSDQIVNYTRCGDSAIWTGHYLAAESYRYAVTKSPEALTAVRNAIQGINMLLNVTGNNLLARCFVPAGSQYAGPIAQEEQHNGIYTATYNGDQYLWVGNTSRDQYAGVFYGLTVAHDVVDDSGVQGSVGTWSRACSITCVATAGSSSCPMEASAPHSSAAASISSAF